MTKYFVAPSEPMFGFVSHCSCKESVIVMRGECSEHNKKWEARIDANYIQELIGRVERLENVLLHDMRKGAQKMCYDAKVAQRKTD
jgi:hypothetical protein